MKSRNVLFLLFLIVSQFAQAQFSWFGGDTKKKHHEVVYAVAGLLNALLKGRTREALEKELLLKMLLSRDSQFTMLMRSIEEVSDLSDDFFD